jgi:hypothetical protein
MIRFAIYAKITSNPKMKFGPLFRNRRTYKTEKSAKGVLRKQEEYSPELTLKVVPVKVHKCHECGTELIK